MKFLIERKYRFARHLILWLGVWAFFVYFFSYNSGNIPYIVVFSTALLPVTALTTYIIVYHLIPRYLLRQELLWFGIYLFFTFLFTTFCTVLSLILSVAYIPGLRMKDMPLMSRNYLFILLLVYLVVALVSVVSVWKQNIKAAARNHELRHKILESQIHFKEQELEYLKTQIHPHFLFNTLNTIYRFALKQSRQTPDIILKLSDLLDYILYQKKKPKVSLQDEINHLKQYIELEKIRFQDTLEVSFVSEDVNEHIQVAPMLLLPFVENAFKHGRVITGVLKVRVMIRTTDHNLHFRIQNTYKPELSTAGIGLENIQKRLQLLYPDSYTLQITAGEKEFEVDLTVDHQKLMGGCERSGV